LKKPHLNGQKKLHPKIPHGGVLFWYEIYNICIGEGGEKMVFRMRE
jgi:hypothetical protein